MTNEENEYRMPALYDLEDLINQCWTVKEDLSLIRKNVDHLLKEGVLEDSLMGLEILIDLRFEKMFSVFEDIVHSQKLVKRDNELEYVEEGALENAIKEGLKEFRDGCKRTYPADSAISSWENELEKITYRHGDINK